MALRRLKYDYIFMKNIKISLKLGKIKKFIKKELKYFLANFKGLEILVLIAIIAVYGFPQHTLADEIKETVEILNITPKKPIFLSLAPTKQPKKVKPVIATAYISVPEQTDDTPFITASGVTVRDGIIATNCLSFGTRVRFKEYNPDKIYVVQDRMHSRFKCDRIDFWLDAPNSEAKEFGVKYLTMEIW